LTTYSAYRSADDHEHVHFFGTSVSAPHVAGAIALALELDSTLTVDSVKAFLASTPSVDGNCFNVLKFLHQVAVCTPGDANGSTLVDIDDILHLIAYIFLGGPPPVGGVCCGDANGSCACDIDDVMYLINYVFTDGPEPIPSCYTCP